MGPREAASGGGRSGAQPGETGSDSGYEEAYYVASEYRDNRMFEDKLCDPMIEELFVAAKDDDSYQKVLWVVGRVQPRSN